MNQLPESLDLDQPEINFVNMPNAVQSEIYVNNLIRISMSHPDFALKLANQILGGSATARLFMNLREDKGFTYGSYSSASTSRYISSFSASASVRNEVTDSSVVEIIKEINKIRNENVSEEVCWSKRNICWKFHYVNRETINNCWICFKY